MICRMSGSAEGSPRQRDKTPLDSSDSSSSGGSSSSSSGSKISKRGSKRARSSERSPGKALKSAQELLAARAEDRHKSRSPPREDAQSQARLVKNLEEPRDPPEGRLPNQGAGDGLLLLGSSTSKSMENVRENKPRGGGKCQVGHSKSGKNLAHFSRRKRSSARIRPTKIFCMINKVRW